MPIPRIALRRKRLEPIVVTTRVPANTPSPEDVLCKMLAEYETQG